MPALWIAHVTVTDEEAYGRYAALAGPRVRPGDGAVGSGRGPARRVERLERRRGQHQVGRAHDVLELREGGGAGDRHDLRPRHQPRQRDLGRDGYRFTVLPGC